MAETEQLEQEAIDTRRRSHELLETSERDLRAAEDEYAHNKRTLFVIVIFVFVLMDAHILTPQPGSRRCSGGWLKSVL